MRTDKCEIIQDLLPLYIDQGLSPASQKFVSEHLESCDECRKLYERMDKKMAIPSGREQITAPINRMKKSFFRKALNLFLSVFLVLSVVISLLAVFFSSVSSSGTFTVCFGVFIFVPDAICTVCLPGGSIVLKLAEKDPFFFPGFPIASLRRLSS